MEKEWEAGLQ